MASFFGTYSPLNRFLTKVADLMVLNLLFVATSLPVVTLGATLTALNDVSIKLVTEQYDSVSRSYLTSLKANAKQGSLLGLACLGLLLVMGAWWVVIENLTLGTLAKAGLLVVFFLLLFRLIGALIWVFPYQATFENSVGQVLNNARRLSAKHPLTTFNGLVVLLLPIIVTIFYPAFVVYGALWLAFGFSGIAFLNAIVMANTFKKYGLKA